MPWCWPNCKWVWCMKSKDFNPVIDYHNQLLINTLRPRQNGRHFADDIFKWISLTENAWTSINMSLVQFNNIPALVQKMAWRRPGDKPLSEPMMLSLLTHICVTRPQWVKTIKINTISPQTFAAISTGKLLAHGPLIFGHRHTSDHFPFPNGHVQQFACNLQPDLYAISVLCIDSFNANICLYFLSF